MIIERNIIKEPLISVVIPVYKEEKILESILSRYNKEIRNKFKIEIIVSDGGSEDKTVEIAEKYADKVIVHTEKRRQTIAEGRNAGAAHATGKVIVFINGDTYPENIENFFAFIYKWLCDTNLSDKYPALATRVYVEKSEITFADKIFYNCFNQYVNFLNLIGVGMCRGECQIIKRELFEKVGGYNSKLAAGEDFDLFKRIAKIAETKYTSKITVIESPRRFRQDGYIKVLYHWTKNGINVILNGKSGDDKWEAVR